MDHGHLELLRKQNLVIWCYKCPSMLEFWVDMGGVLL